MIVTLVSNVTDVTDTAGELLREKNETKGWGFGRIGVKEEEA